MIINLQLHVRAFLMSAVLFISALLVFSSCRDNGTSAGNLSDGYIDTQEHTQADSLGNIFITDYTGKKWNVTHAVTEYGFDPDRFQYGLGQFAIRPIQNPEFISNGDPGFPDSHDQTVVLGVRIGDDARAYALRHIISHEVVNDNFDDLSVAPAY